MQNSYGYLVKASKIIPLLSPNAQINVNRFIEKDELETALRFMKHDWPRDLPVITDLSRTFEEAVSDHRDFEPGELYVHFADWSLFDMTPTPEHSNLIKKYGITPKFYAWYESFV